MITIISIDVIKVVFVHGFNVRDKGRKTIDALLPYFRKMYPNAFLDKDNADYGWHGLIKVRFHHKPAVKRIAKAISNADIVVTHSNGANYTHQALELLKSKGISTDKLHIIHFSPALNRKQKLEKLSFKRLDLFASEGDKIVWLAKLLFLHPWGNAGQKGFITTDERYHQHQYYKTGHSAWLKEGTLRDLVMHKIYKIRSSL